MKTNVTGMRTGMKQSFSQVEAVHPALFAGSSEWRHWQCDYVMTLERLEMYVA